MSEQLRYAVVHNGSVCTIRFEHASTRNALDRYTRQSFVDLLATLDADPLVRVIVVTGTDPAFTSGVDAKQLLEDPNYVAPPVDPATALRSLATPTIAAVNGSCVSGGLEIALACSFIIASDRARFADTHAKIGLTPGWGLSVELPAAIGVRRARQLTLTGHAIDAAIALEWGLVNEVVSHELLEGRTAQIAEAIAMIESGSIENAITLYRIEQETMLHAARAVERQRLASWKVDRASSRENFAVR